MTNLVHKFLFIIILSMCLMQPNQAHHGWSWYGGEALELNGMVIEKHFRNPHDYIMVRVDNITWKVFFGPPARNRRAGLTSDVFEVGNMVTVFGHQHADAKKREMKTERIMIGEKIYNMYPERD